MPALAGLGAALLAVGVWLLAWEFRQPDARFEMLGLGALLVGAGTTVLDVGLSA